jgi:hypothetical protein
MTLVALLLYILMVAFGIHQAIWVGDYAHANYFLITAVLIAQSHDRMKL